MLASRKTALPAVVVIDLFAAEGHIRIAQPGRKRRPAIQDTAVLWRGAGDRFKHEDVALAISLELGMGGGLDEFGG